MLKRFGIAVLVSAKFKIPHGLLIILLPVQSSAHTVKCHVGLGGIFQHLCITVLCFFILPVKVFPSGFQNETAIFRRLEQLYLIVVAIQYKILIAVHIVQRHREGKQSLPATDMEKSEAP